MDVGAATLHVQGSTSMVQDLVQAQITYTSPTPTVTVDRATGRVVIAQRSDFAFLGRRSSIDLLVELNTAIRWHFLTRSGASTDTYDLPNVDVAGIEIDTGGSTETMSLGFPTGFVPVSINGGALTVHLHRDSRSSASVKVSGGAVSLDFDGAQSSGVGSLSHSTGDAADIFQVTVSGGACTVTMDTGTPLD